MTPTSPPDAPPPRTGVLGAVVLFHPGAAAATALRALAPQVDTLVVVDNTPGASSAATSVWPEPPASVRWVALGENRGVAHALNVALARAREEGSAWLVTFDQDTAVEPGYVRRMLDGAARWPGGPPAVVAPALPGDGGAPGLSEVPRAITSGALARVDALVDAGGHREDLFIDYVDFELCLRLRARGHRIVRNGDVVLGHRIGAPRAHKLGALRIVTTNHAPVRRYYKCRNRVVLARAHFRAEPRWFARELLSTFWEAAKIVALEEDRTAKLRMMARGVADGLAGRLGPYAEEGR